MVSTVAFTHGESEHAFTRVTQQELTTAAPTHDAAARHTPSVALDTHGCIQLGFAQ